MQLSSENNTLLVSEPRLQSNKIINILDPLYSLIPNSEVGLWTSVRSNDPVPVDIQEYERPPMTRTKEIMLFDKDEAFRLEKNRLTEKDILNFSALGIEFAKAGSAEKYLIKFFSGLSSDLDNIEITDGYYPDVLDALGDAIRELESTILTAESRENIAQRSASVLIALAKKLAEISGSVAKTVFTAALYEDNLSRWARRVRDIGAPAFSYITANVAWAYFLRLFQGDSPDTSSGSMYQQQASDSSAESSMGWRYALYGSSIVMASWIVSSLTARRAGFTATSDGVISVMDKFLAFTSLQNLASTLSGVREFYGELIGWRWVCWRHVFTKYYGPPDNIAGTFSVQTVVDSSLNPLTLIYYSTARRIAVLSCDYGVFMSKLDFARNNRGAIIDEAERYNEKTGEKETSGKQDLSQRVQEATFMGRNNGPELFLKRKSRAFAAALAYKKLLRHLVACNFAVVLVPLTNWRGQNNLSDFGTEVTRHAGESLFVSWIQESQSVNLDEYSAKTMYAPIVPDTMQWISVSTNAFKLYKIRSSPSTPLPVFARNDTRIQQAPISMRDDESLGQGQMVVEEQQMTEDIVNYVPLRLNERDRSSAPDQASFYARTTPDASLAYAPFSPGQNTLLNYANIQNIFFFDPELDADHKEWKAAFVEVLEKSASVLENRAKPDKNIIYIPGYLGRSPIGQFVGGESLVNMSAAVHSVTDGMFSQSIGAPEFPRARTWWQTLRRTDDAGSVSFKGIFDGKENPKVELVIEFIPQEVRVYAFVPTWMAPTVEQYGLLTFRQLCVLRQKSPDIMSVVQRCTQDFCRWIPGLAKKLKDMNDDNEIIETIEEATHCRSLRFFTNPSHEVVVSFSKMISSNSQLETAEELMNTTTLNVRASYAPGILGAYSIPPSGIVVYQVSLNALAHGTQAIHVVASRDPVRAGNFTNEGTLGNTEPENNEDIGDEQIAQMTVEEERQRSFEKANRIRREYAEDFATAAIVTQWIEGNLSSEEGEAQARILSLSRSLGYGNGLYIQPGLSPADTGGVKPQLLNIYVRSEEMRTAPQK